MTDHTSDQMKKDKKQQFMPRQQDKRLPVRTLIIAGIVIAAGLLVYILISGGAGTHAVVLADPVAEPRSYIGKVVAMTAIEPEVADNQVIVRSADVDRLSIVRFMQDDAEGIPVPVMAYMTSAGRLFVGNCRCACGGSDFALAGKTLVCSACRTTYDIEDQTFISGAAICRDNPPAGIKFELRNGLIKINLADIQNVPIRTTAKSGPEVN